jgi:hypothetical protein
MASKPTLVVYVGHDGLMDFTLTKIFQGAGHEKRDAIVLACASKSYFASGLRPTGAQPLLWTTGLMAPEAYTLKAALDGWTAGESAQEISRARGNSVRKISEIQHSRCAAAFRHRLVTIQEWVSRYLPSTTAACSQSLRSSGPNAARKWLSMSSSPTILPFAKTGTTISDLVSREQAR